MTVELPTRSPPLDCRDLRRRALTSRPVQLFAHIRAQTHAHENPGDTRPTSLAIPGIRECRHPEIPPEFLDW